MTTETDLLAADERDRIDALDVTRSFIVQAPAGSGKTELLIQRYLRLLAIVEHPEEVLAITFTRKAAAEMQLRVLAALRRSMRGEMPEQPHEKITAEAASQVLQRDHECDWKLISNPRRLRIQTLDSLNATLARAQPLTSANGVAGANVVADSAMKQLYRDAAALTLDQLAEPGELQAATRNVLAHVDNNAGLYIEYLARMLATRDQWLPIVGSGMLDGSDVAMLRDAFEASLDTVNREHLGQLTDRLPPQIVDRLLPLVRYAIENRSAGEPGGTKADGVLWQLPGTDAEDVRGWQELADLMLTAQGGWRRQLNKRQGFVPDDSGQKSAMLELIEFVSTDDALRQTLHDTRALPPTSYSDDQWEVLLSLFRLLPVTVIELKRLFVENGLSDHIEVALSAAMALGTAENPGDVALLLDYQLRHLLVDEMQDTSSAQYAMLEALTGGWAHGDGRTLFCVGDPMQSIYRFRNAEVGEFLAAQQHGIGGIDLTSLTLRRNFRSGEVLVNWFNDVFPSVLAAKDDPTQGAVRYSEAAAVASHAGQGRHEVHPLIDATPEEEATRSCGLVQALLDEHPRDEVAVLVRSRPHLASLSALFREKGVDYRAVEIDRLTDLPEIIDVLALTRALVHQGDRLAWLALLRGPWVGLDWSDLHALVVNDSKATVWECLHDETRLSGVSNEGQRALTIFRDAITGLLAKARTESLRSRVETAWWVLGGPALLQSEYLVDNVYRFLDVVESLEVAGTLPDVAVLESALDFEHVSSSKDARVQVMTMHRAKGLQFDHVVLHGLGRVPRPPDYEVLSWIDVTAGRGGSNKLISPVGPRADVEKDPIHRYINQVESRKDRNELSRLLYVACTRARKSLHLVGHARQLKKGVHPDPRSMLHLLWPSVAAEFAQVPSSETAASSASAGNAWRLPLRRRFVREWALPELPPDPVASTSESTDEIAARVEFYWVGAEARIAGTLAHRFIQLATDGQLTLDKAALPDLRPVTRRWLSEVGVDPESNGPVEERVERILTGLADDPRGRWLLKGEGHAELALSGLVDGRVQSVLIDRVRIDDGIHWIVDYKTGGHEGGRTEEFLAAEVERYKDQLRKYATIYRNYCDADIRCALYFPLLQAFVEVNPES
jgi:ATP-dependent exoDNAse (exonuclease V) beta subunit